MMRDTSRTAVVTAALVTGALLASLLPVSPAGAEGSAPAGARADSLPAPIADPSAAIHEARAHYEQAWAHRDAGDLDAARDEVVACLAALATLQGTPLNASQHREATELGSRANGLADALAAQAEASARNPAGNDAVLDSPAADGIDVQFNQDVYQWIDYFSGAGRSAFERWLRRSGRYMEMFRSILEREGLPPDLVHLVFVESGFNLNARSVSAAVGPWQFVRSTARLFGLTVNQWVDERKDPEKSTVAAARYLKHLYSIFNDWPLALASYNAGEGAVLRAVKRQGTTDYWKLRLPAQTESYVPQFMAALAIAREPERYGFDGIELEAPMDFDEIALVGAVDLRAIARVAAVDYEELRQLNPAILRHTATGRYGVTTVRVPRGTGEEILRKLQSGEETLPAVKLSINHRVRRGETMTRIANQYGVSAQALANANHITRRNPLRRGMVLTIPSSLKRTPPQPVPADFVGPMPPASVVPTRALTAPVLRVPVAAAPDGHTLDRSRPYRTVRVRRGETLGGIAAREGVSVTQIMRWNGLKRAAVRRGQRLRIQVPEAQPTPGDALAAAAEAQAQATMAAAPGSEPPPRPTTVRVRKGDTLTSLARRHGITIEALMKANGLRSGRQLKAGQRLIIPEA